LSDSNLRPEDLFNTYFYGDFLHGGDNAGKLIDINSEDGNAARHMFGFLTSMSALAHLYFGFSVLVESAQEVHRPTRRQLRHPDTTPRQQLLPMRPELAMQQRDQPQRRGGRTSSYRSCIGPVISTPSGRPDSERPI
jgi:hypothetical protein